jgi:hypothetical protein
LLSKHPEVETPLHEELNRVLGNRLPVLSAFRTQLLHLFDCSYPIGRNESDRTSGELDKIFPLVSFTKQDCLPARTLRDTVAPTDEAFKNLRWEQARALHVCDFTPHDGWLRQRETFIFSKAEPNQY